MAEPPTEDPRRGTALALAASAFAAVFLLAYQSANQSAPRTVVVFAMLACATLLNGGLALALPRADRRHVSRKVTVITILVFAVLTIGGNFGVAGALPRLGPGLTGTILQVQIFLVALGGRLFLGETITRWFIFGAVVAFGGFIVLGIQAPGQISIDPIGVGFALLGACSFAGILLWTRGAIQHIDPVFVNVARLVLAVAVLALLPGQVDGVLALDASVWLMIVLAAALGPTVSRLCLMFAARHLSASRTKLITLVSPVLAFALEWAVLGDAPSPREVAGGTLILVGVLLPTVARARQEAKLRKSAPS